VKLTHPPPHSFDLEPATLLLETLLSGTLESRTPDFSSMQRNPTAPQKSASSIHFFVILPPPFFRESETHPPCFHPPFSLGSLLSFFRKQILLKIVFPELPIRSFFFPRPHNFDYPPRTLSFFISQSPTSFLQPTLYWSCAHNRYVLFLVRVDSFPLSSPLAQPGPHDLPS